MTSPVCPQLQTNCCTTASVEEGQKAPSALKYGHVLWRCDRGTMGNGRRPGACGLEESPDRSTPRSVCWRPTRAQDGSAPSAVRYLHPGNLAARASSRPASRVRSSRTASRSASMDILALVVSQENSCRFRLPRHCTAPLGARDERERESADRSRSEPKPISHRNNLPPSSSGAPVPRGASGRRGRRSGADMTAPLSSSQWLHRRPRFRWKRCLQPGSR